VAFDATAACGDDTALATEAARVIDAALAALSDGRDPLIYTARGPDDPAVAAFRQTLADRWAARIISAGSAMEEALDDLRDCTL